jgi:lantibiotic transport system permease protein
MLNAYLHSFQSEWLKKRRSAAAWLTVAGALLVPVIILIARFIDRGGLATVNRSARLWESLYDRSWQFMAFFLLPMGVVLATSLITQLEFRNNAWKQVCTTPQTLTMIFLTKFSVILVMLLQFFVLFNVGIYLEGALPSLLREVPYPTERIPFASLLRGNGKFMLDCLPIVALQYLLSLQFRNFLIPLGAGLGLYVGAMIAAHWKYGYTVPYTYATLEYIGARSPSGAVNFHAWAAAYFCGFLVLAYILYITKKEKG